MSWSSKLLAEKECIVCRARSRFISESIGVCVDCLRNRPAEALEYVNLKHSEIRLKYGLPPNPPKTARGIPCKLCANNCIIGEGEKGYCGLRMNKSDKLLQIVNNKIALLHYYLDPHVTNCCSSWFCPAGTGHGYPRYAVRINSEIGYYNLALFFYGCSFNCLFCQNWNHKFIENAEKTTVDELVNVTLRNNRITCWCWFGGSPEPQLPFAIESSRKITEEKPSNRILRICFEWNGSGNPSLVKRVGEIALETGGNIKFDLKAYTSSIHQALTGRDNIQTLKNFELIYREFYNERRDVPMLTATTLLVPYYVDEAKDFLDAATVDFKGNGEVEFLRKYVGVPDPEPIFQTLLELKNKTKVHIEITDLVVPKIGDSLKAANKLVKWVYDNLGPDTPIHFLRFHPDYRLLHLPLTPVETLEKHYELARKAGLNYVYIGNVPGHPYENTYCPECGKIVVERRGFDILGWYLDRENKCRFCGYKIAVYGSPPPDYRTSRFIPVFFK